MNKLLLLAAAGLTLTGCATYEKRPVSQDAAKELRGQSVATTTRKLPDFTAMTPTKAAFGLLGAAAMVSDGNNIVNTNKVADPANAIASRLSSALSASYAASVAPTPVAVTSDDVAAIAAGTNGAARFVLDVQTINWSFVYFPTAWGSYRVIYTAKARLIDTTAKTVVAEGFCKRIPEDSTNAPSYDDLVANEATRLKSELALATEECVKTLKAEMLAV
jgi:hypothetical protein